MSFLLILLQKKEVIQLIRYLLAPISVIYGVIIRLRHWAYDFGIFKSVSFNLPVICVGNVSVGGTGKTPMVEYLIRQLLPNYRVGVVSRGYKRKTKGQVLADVNSSVFDLGDEPFQFWRKYPEIDLVVDSDRVKGVEKLMSLPSPPKIILLDDAFQHRRVQAQKNVLLTAYGDLYTDDYLLPTGNLRDIKARASQADVIVVTKCPPTISEAERSQIIQKIRRKPMQKVVFATISYAGKVYSQSEVVDFQGFISYPFVLVTGIANPHPLLAFLDKNKADYTHLKFSDHHHFTNSEIEKLKKQTRILTTEKDFVRLQNNLPEVYYLPIETVFVLENDEKIFWEALRF